ncbi:MAG: M67 family metallopeptidase [Candidatus Dormibacteraceae bacterium]
MTTLITAAAMAEVRSHVVEGYPSEICGMLLVSAGSAVINQTRRVGNTVIERARDRYEMDPIDQIRIQRECDQGGLEIIGYYHSHPDHPAMASSTDCQRSWAGPIYLIVSCYQGEVREANAFIAESDGGAMHQVELRIL